MVWLWHRHLSVEVPNLSMFLVATTTLLRCGMLAALRISLIAQTRQQMVSMRLEASLSPPADIPS